jgi:hypothetical protein
MLSVSKTTVSGYDGAVANAQTDKKNFSAEE